MAADRSDIPSRLVAQVPDPLPVTEFLRGRRVEAVLELVPRLFNLCREAQLQAMRLAFGRESPDPDGIFREIRREHILRMAVTLPLALGVRPIDVPRDDRADVKDALFGADGFPDTVPQFEAFLQGGQGVAPVFAEVARRFEPGEAVVKRLPPAWDSAIFSTDALENSVGARQADHPVMRYVEALYGRGPLWRIVARALDLEAVMDRRLPGPRKIAEGTVVVSAARGLYAVKVKVEDGKLADMVRMTPTDHLLARGGIMEQSLATLPQNKHDQAEVVLSILDPCVPIQITEQHHA